MVEPPPELTPIRPPERGRPRPSPRQVAMRRAVAVAVVAAVAAAAVWGATAALDGGSSKTPATTKAAVRPPVLRIIFPEGFTRAQMAERITAVDGIARRKRHVDPRLSAAQYLALTRRSALPARFARDGKRRPLEGFLFPATYSFTPKTTSRQLVAAQLQAFRKNWKRIDLGYARKKKLTPYDVLIIASMIEKEAVAPEERPKIAAVIYNRLHLRMTLGIDATLRYGLNIPPTESIRQSQLESLNPYNTRKLVGLPPTPVANPGLASMQAAAHPARVRYIYFVRKPDKVHHFFTASAQAFENYKHAHGYR